jgi:RNA polymerase sigma factor (sigma-70 family)
MWRINTGPIAEYAAQALETPGLTASEELDLAREVRREAVLFADGLIGPGERPARDRLYLTNLRLVVHVAGWFTGRGIDLADLIQEGNIALGEAVDSYDPERPNRQKPGMPIRFSTHATWILRGRFGKVVSRKIRTVNLDRLPDVPTEDEPPQDDQFDPTAKLEELMDALTDRERQVVTLRYGLGFAPGDPGYCGLLNREIAKVFHITSKRIQQIDARAVEKMAAMAGHRRRKKTRASCPKGHPLTGENAYSLPHSNNVLCRECRKRANKRHAEATRRRKQAV